MSDLLFEQAMGTLHEVHRKHRFQTNFWALAESLGYRVHYAEHSHCAYGEPPVIYLSSYEYCRARVRRQNSFIGMHEVVHLIFKAKGIERELFKFHGHDMDVALPRLERWCNYGAGVLLMPDHRVNRAYERFGHGPEMIWHLHRGAKVGMGVAVRRYVYLNPHQSAAAFVTNGRYVCDVAKQLCHIPIWRGQHLPDEFPELQGRFSFPVSEELSVQGLVLPGGKRVLGVLVG